MRRCVQYHRYPNSQKYLSGNHRNFSTNYRRNGPVIVQCIAVRPCCNLNLPGIPWKSKLCIHNDTPQPMRFETKVHLETSAEKYMLLTVNNDGWDSGLRVCTPDFGMKFLAATKQKACSSMGDVPYCLTRSSIKCQGHRGKKITNFNLNWAFPDCNYSWIHQWLWYNAQSLM